jgi:hypothetical protein
MNIWDMLAIAIVVWIAYKVGQLSITIPIKMAVKQMADNQGVTTAELLAELQSLQNHNSDFENQLTIEQHDAQYFAYSDGQFLAQAADFDQLFARIKHSYPNLQFRVNSSMPGLTAAQHSEMTRSLLATFGDRND